MNRHSDIVVSDADNNAKGLGSNTGEDIDVCKFIMPSQHRSALNSHRAASPLVSLVKGEERRETPDPPLCSLSKLGVKPSKNRFVIYICSKLRLETGVTKPFAMMNFFDLYLTFVDKTTLVTTT
ncbi:hypothetical protein TNCV_4544861 [Trichonephila clavipes]|nr:hypothetical protein TNCV_4544861 [Trichonephila clavipes]